MIEIKPVNYKTAFYSVMNWHYSKRMPVGKNVFLGVWEDKQFIGTVIYGMGACSTYHVKFNINKNEICELLRVALKEHKEFTSRIVSLSLKIIKKMNVKIKAVISFADTNQKHIGKLYQACNFYYIGQSTNGKKYIKDGKEIHSRHVSEKGIRKFLGNKWVKCYKPSECKVIKEPPKIRYIYI